MKSMGIWGLSVAILAGCAGMNDGSGASGSQTNAAPADKHTSQNALDWAGAYEGVLPCADCPGIKTRLTLKPGARYELSTQYVDRQPAPQVASGSFSWNATGNVITLDGNGQRYAVGEGRLLLLDRDGPPNWSNSANRVLNRVPATNSASPSTAGLLQTLEDHRWTLASATDAQGQRLRALVPAGGRPIVFTFSGSRLHVQGACNQLTGAFQISPAGLLTVGSLASSMMACEPALMQADRSLSDLLAKGLQADFVKGATPTLRLVDASKASLTLTGQATPEALYGPGTRIFMEVAAQRVACKNPLNGESLCLQVRDRVFDEKGLKVGVPGEWRPLYETIEGYQHTPGVRNVVRLKKFQRASAPAGASSKVYVLDLVVESETVKP